MAGAVTQMHSDEARLEYSVYNIYLPCIPKLEFVLPIHVAACLLELPLTSRIRRVLSKEAAVE